MCKFRKHYIFKKSIKIDLECLNYRMETILTFKMYLQNVPNFNRKHHLRLNKDNACLLYLLGDRPNLLYMLSDRPNRL